MPIALVGVIGFYLLINGIAEFVTRKMFAVIGWKPLEVAFGILMAGGGGWALWRVLTGHAAPGTTRRQLAVAVAVLVGIAALGLGFLIDGLAGG